MANYKGGTSEAPEQYTHPSEASKGYMTNKDGVAYPEELSRKAKDYLDGEGSMGFERNQGVKRDGWKSEVDVNLGMGQSKLQKLSAANGGSHSI